MVLAIKKGPSEYYEVTKYIMKYEIKKVC
jgi:hypothetical protein